MASYVRTWLIRAAILAGLALVGFAAYTGWNWVSPEKVRQAVLDHLATKVADDVEVQLGSAELRLFGGVCITDLQFTRRGEGTPFLVIPRGVLTHDKEKLQRGILEVRKFEIERMTLRVERNAEGKINLEELFRVQPGETLQTMPTLLVKDATIFVTSTQLGGPPPLALCGLKLSLLNDPLPIVKIEGSGEIALAAAVDANGKIEPGVFRVPVQASFRWHRTANHLTAHIETSELELGPDHAALAAPFYPQAAVYLQQFGGSIALKSDFDIDLTMARRPKYDLRVELKNGKFEDPALPWPLSQLTGTVRLNDGKLSVQGMTGKLGNANAELALESKPDLLCPRGVTRQTIPGSQGIGPRWPNLRLQTDLLANAMPGTPIDFCADDPLKAVEERLDRLEFRIRKLSLDDDLFARLTPGAQKIRTMFAPKGAVDVGILFRRIEAGQWRREVEVTPQDLSIRYEYFPYPIVGMYGSLKKVNGSDGTDEFQVKITASASGKRLTLDGRIAGEGSDPLVDLTIAGKDIPIDGVLLAALPGKYGESLTKLGASARGDFTVTLKREHNVNRWENTFKVKVYNGSIQYAAFPYALKQVRGTVLVKANAYDKTRPLKPGVPHGEESKNDRVELTNFEAVHDGGRLWLSGESAAVPGTIDRKLTLNVQGENCPIDESFKAGLKALKLDGVLATLNPRGELTFGSEIEIWERGSNKPAPVEAKVETENGVKPAVALLPAEPPFDPKQDLRIAFNFRGPSITPSFFPYDLHQLAGLVRYRNNRVEVIDLSARHGQSAFKVGAGDIRIGGNGAVWANLGAISVDPLIGDPQFYKALPGKFRTGFEQLNLRGPAELTVKHLVISVPGSETSEIQELEPKIINASFSVKEFDPPSARLPFSVSKKAPPAPASAMVTSGLGSLNWPWQRRGLLPDFAMPTGAPSPGMDVPNAVVYWNASLKLKGAAVEIGVPFDDVHGAISTEGRFEATHLGSVMGTAWFDRATVAKQPVTQAKVGYKILPQQPDPKKSGSYLPAVVVFRDLNASIFGGSIEGQGRVVLADSLRFQLWLTAAGVKLEELAKQNKLGPGEVKGLVQGNILLENPVDSRTGKAVLTGTGQVDIPQGRLYDLPVFLELVKVLKGHTPDRVAFEEAHATFELKGDRLKVTQLDLLGSAVSLGGSGELDLKGQDVHFEFYTIWSQTLRKWLTTPFGDVAGLLSGGLFKIELTRVNGELTPRAVMLPAVTEPVRNVAERLRNRLNRDPGPPPVARGASR